MANVKKADCALLPPCQKILKNKVQRANYVSIIWANAGSPQPDQGLDPVQFGWKSYNGHFTPHLFPRLVEPDNLFKDVPDVRRTEITENAETSFVDLDTDSGPEWSDDSNSDSD